MDTRKSLSIAEYVSLEEPAGVRYELSHGQLIVTPSPSLRHNTIRDRLSFSILGFPGIETIGAVCSGTDMILDVDTVRRPDVAIIRADRLQGIDLDEAPMPLAPDLAVEIVSREDRAEDLMEKISQYLQGGVRAVWVLYPRQRVAYRYSPDRPEAEVRTEQSHDVFSEPTLLPEFTLPLNELFA